MVLLALLPLAAGAQKVERVALLGCIKQYNKVPALKDYHELNADLYLWIGDNVYADTEEDPTHIKKCYDKLAKKKYFQKVRSQGMHIATWDDHDYGLNNAGRHYPFKEQSRKYFIDFWELEKEIPDDREGIYYSKMYEHGGKKLQIIMLDVRYNRDDEGPENDVLGEAQWAWLEEEVQKPADLRFIVSGFQYLLDYDTGSETWRLFPTAYNRMVDLIYDNKVQHALFLTGDQHYGEVSRMDGQFGYNAYEIQFSGLNQIEEPEDNSYRVSPVCRSKHSYAYIDIHWDADEPHLIYTVGDAKKNKEEFTYRININELQHDFK